jgi:hypothetical protein
MRQAFPKILCPNCGARLAVSSYEPAIACSCGAFRVLNVFNNLCRFER